MDSDAPNNEDVNARLLEEYKDQPVLNASENKIISSKNTSAISDPTQNTNSKFEMILYIITVTFLLFVLIIIFYYIHYGEYKVEPLFEDKDIIKPLVDRRKYKIIKLENNLEVMLISDRNASICSAAMSVDVGSLMDNEIQGLAHYTEHALFLGSQSYPKPSSFEKHLNYYFGKSNAYTTEDKTIFYFEVEWLGFEKAMEMFTKIFQEPLFDVSKLQLEIEAINSEFEKNLYKDSWRENQLIKSLTDQFSPFSNFGTGNSNTLRRENFPILFEKMKKFYDDHYLPNYMRLVVRSNQNMEQLQNTVAFYFSELKNAQEKELIRRLNEEESEHKNQINDHNIDKSDPFHPENLGQIVWFEKLSDGQHVDIFFVLDEIISKIESKPLDFISYHIKFSGKGSLIDYLYTNNYFTKLDAGVISSLKHFSIYGLTIYLTQEGLNKVKDIIQYVFNYLNFIKREGINITVYEEMKKIKDIQFKFKENSELISEETAKLASYMLNYKRKDYRNILHIDYILSKYNEDDVKEFLKKINPENSLIIVGSTYFPEDRLNNLIDSDSEDKIEKWYGTKYKINKLSDEYINELESNSVSQQNFTLRSPNQYVTKEKSIVSCYGVNVVESYINSTLQEKCEEEFFDLTPKLVVDSKNLKMWYKVNFYYLINSS